MPNTNPTLHTLAHQDAEALETVENSQTKCITCRKIQSSIDEPLIKCPFCQQPKWCSEACTTADEEPHLNECLKYVREVFLISKLSDDQKDQFFHQELEDRKKKEKERAASDLLQDAAKLDEGVLDVFQTKSTLVDNMPFRLLRIGRPGDAESISSYIAVSYCWHSDDWSVLPTLTKQTNPPLPLTVEMFDALKTLRKSDDEGIWIDQICIKQSDEVEKQCVIASMDLVYSSARKVVVVLEDIFITEEEHQTFQDWTDAVVRDGPFGPLPGNLSCIQSLFLKLLSSRWFSRAWCIHEHHVSSRCDILVSGTVKKQIYVISLELMVEFINKAIKFDSSFPPEDDLETGRKWRNIKGVGDAVTINTSAQAKEAPPLTDLFATISSLNATVPSDKLSIVLNIASLGISLIPGRKLEIQECWYFFSLICMALGDMRCLTSRGSSIGKGDIMSSWLQWPDPTRVGRLLPLPKPLHKRHQIQSTPLCLSLDIYFLSGVVSSEPSEPSKAVATNFVFSDLGKSVLAHLIKTRRKIRDQLLADSLAAVVDCGPEWLIKFYQDIWPSFNQVNPSTPVKAELDQFGSAMVQALFPTFVSRAPPSDYLDTLVKSLLQFITYQFLRGPAVYRIITFGEPARKALTDFVSTDQQLAVPVCLAEPQFMEFNRFWVVSPVEMREGLWWRPVEKLQIFGCPEISENEDLISLKRQVKIVG